MKHRALKALALSLALAATAGAAAAQAARFDPRTGDAWVDTWLGDMNSYAMRYREPFISEIVRYYGAPRDVVRGLLDRNGWTPGDVYYACSIASVLGRPCRDIANAHDRDRGQGWGVIAQRMGIKPGSAEFHRLKQGMVGSYDRWGRPIVLDEQLRRDFPGRGAAARDAPAKGASVEQRGPAKARYVDQAGHGRPAHAGGNGKRGGSR